MESDVEFFGPAVWRYMICRFLQEGPVQLFETNLSCV